MCAAGPIVKWVGGKTKLLPELRARTPKVYKRYFEPFFGGGALFFALAPRDAIVGDTNMALIDTYRTVGSNVDAVIKRLEMHRVEHGASEKYYYEVRDGWNDRVYNTDPVGAAAAFLYMNKTCYNGLWRVNKNGGFNTPRGDYKDPKIFDPADLREAALVLKNADFRTTPYDTTTVAATAGDFVYFDPPYDPVSKTSNFVGYSRGGFGKLEQRQLAEHVRALHARGVFVMLSNSDTAYVRELYAGFCVDDVRCARSINSKGDRRGQVGEVIVTTYEYTS